LVLELLRDRFRGRAAGNDSTLPARPDLIFDVASQLVAGRCRACLEARTGFGDCLGMLAALLSSVADFGDIGGADSSTTRGWRSRFRAVAVVSAEILQPNRQRSLPRCWPPGEIDAPALQGQVAGADPHYAVADRRR
jgi:hypothetical protein